MRPLSIRSRSARLVAAASLCLLPSCQEAVRAVRIRVTVENVSPADLLEPGTPAARPLRLPPGVWLVGRSASPLFEPGTPDRGQGLESLAEDGDPTRLVEGLDAAGEQSGVFAANAVTYETGAIGPGEAFALEVAVLPGDRLHLATMLAESNDWFYATVPEGIPIVSDSGDLLTGDVTRFVRLYDLGTEVDEPIGRGPTQAPRQASPNTGPSSTAAVTERTDEAYAPARVLRVAIRRL